MPPEIKLPQLPFLTREMLAFGARTKWDLEVQIYSKTTFDMKISGTTREAPFTFTIDHTNDGVLNERVLGMTDIPIMLSVYYEQETGSAANTWVNVYLRANETRVAKLIGGYVGGFVSLTWPGSRMLSNLDGNAEVSILATANPAAGAEVSQNVLTNEVWKIRGVSLVLTTDANVANRRVHLKLSVFGVPLWEVESGYDHTASTARTYHFMEIENIPNANNDDDVFVAIPKGRFVGDGYTLETDILNLQATDQISDFNTLYEQFFQD
ncbi:hypothetical protein L0Y40_01275 [Candidatus Wolfebacteria bacterium]|nr:hypothetical protein [Candidatus Wolfebacteria bacterium]